MRTFDLDNDSSFSSDLIFFKNVFPSHYYDLPEKKVSGKLYQWK